MRLPLLLCGLLALAGCSASDPKPATAPTVTPSPSAAPPVVRLVLPAEMNGLPRTTTAKWLKRPKSAEKFLKRHVFAPTGASVAAAYLDPDDISETVEVSAASGQVADPAATLRMLTANSVTLEDVRPAAPGTPGGVGTCGLSREQQPAVATVCHWAEPGSVGWVTIWSLKDRRKSFAGIRAQLQP
ncbi:hypothetical protein [Actinoplanes auranticolor]|uniref:Uncharacterized protein n=1 Tax=Actinoplanes auranticolor TaxID=47988 RepID=A0A919SLG6_9ACTN|nr:hypothetical protein [Actinoplanes auranticolor]GIM74225.1 hypothetical protein Aau02nite_59930 [Actinoplanes auranticolor]